MVGNIPQFGLWDICIDCLGNYKREAMTKDTQPYRDGLGSSQHPSTPKAQGHEAANLSELLQEIYYAGADSILIDWKRDDIQALKDKVTVYVENERKEAYQAGFDNGLETGKLMAGAEPNDGLLGNNSSDKETIPL